MSHEEEKRNLTDADVQALAREMKNEFFGALGRGVWALVWKAVIIALVGIAAVGATKGIK